MHKLCSGLAMNCAVGKLNINGIKWPHVIQPTPAISYPEGISGLVQTTMSLRAVASLTSQEMESHRKLHVLPARLFATSIPSSALLPELSKPTHILRWKAKSLWYFNI